MGMKFWASRSVPEWHVPVLQMAPAILPTSQLAPAPRRVEVSRSQYRTQLNEAAYLVEPLSYDALLQHIPAWADLMTRTLEPNAFLEPSFAVAALQHFAFARRPTFLLIWEADGATERGRLIGLCPLFLPHFYDNRVARTWIHKQSTSGVPLLDSQRAMTTLMLVLDWLKSEHPKVRGLIIPKLAKTGPTFGLLRAISTLRDLPLRLYDEHERAYLPNHINADALLTRALRPKKLKELRRQRRRLADDGALTYRSSTTPDTIRDATELFLALEERGWKGARGTALLVDPHLATFTRTMTRLMAREGKCRIDSLDVGGVPVAMAIVLKSGNRAYFWKTAYDETRAAQSPGVQLTLELTRLQLDDASVASTDSCAIQNHSMIAKIWRHTMPIADVLIGIQPHATNEIEPVDVQERARRSLYDWAKSLYNRYRDFAKI